MTLTLEQVRQTRFHLARRNGYEPVDVDNFVDKVEATLSQLTEENETLRQQVDSLSSAEPSGLYVPGSDNAADPEKDALREELANAQATVGELRAQLEGRAGDAEGLQGEADEHRAAAEQAGAEAQHLRGELDARNAELESLKAELAQVRNDMAAADQSGQVERLNAELDGLRGEIASRDEALNAAQDELGGLRGQLEQAHAQLQQAQQAPAPVAAPTGAVENIVVTAAPEASSAVTKLLQMATEQAERLVGDAQVEANRLVTEARQNAEQTIHEANRKAHEAVTDARTRADRIESEARVNAEKLTTDAQQRAEAVNGEAAARRTELFAALEQERDDLRGRVDHLRSFEGSFRENLTKYLQSQIEGLQNASFEPGDLPSILSEPGNTSATPRLDALLNEDR